MIWRKHSAESKPGNADTGTGSDTHQPLSAFVQQREDMVRYQIERRGIKAPRVLSAMRHIPRHRFLPPSHQPYAYEDHPIQIGCDQTISQPYMVALMTELLALKKSDRVLEIGTGSGYQTAILASLADTVISIERHQELADHARAILSAMDFGNIRIHCADGSLGWPEYAPYDAILVTAGSPQIPLSLKNQLAIGGCLVCPAGPRDVQQLIRIIRTLDGFEEQESIRCVFVPLIGAEGWNVR